MSTLVDIPAEEIQTLVPTESGDLVNDLFLDDSAIQGEKDPYQKIRQEGITAAQEIGIGKVTGVNVGGVLRAWKYSFEKMEDTLPLDDDSYEERQRWIEEASNFTQVLNHVVNGNGPVIGVAGGDGMKKMVDLLRNRELEEPGLLGEYLANRVWYAFDVYDKSKPRWEGLPPKELHTMAGEGLRVSVEVVTPVLKELLPVLMESTEGKGSVRRVFEHLQAAEQKELADSLLVDEGLEEVVRLAVAVQYINIYGFIPAIEAISPLATAREDLKILYNRLQGDRVKEVMADLWQVYRKYEENADFSDYYNDEITKKEISIIEKCANEVCQKFDKTKAEMNVLSLASGKGRMVFAMENAGFSVVAVEPYKPYAQVIKEKSIGLNVKVVNKLWNDITLEDLGFGITNRDLEKQGVTPEYLSTVGGVEKALKIVGKRNIVGVEIGECTGRSIPHGNSPQRLLEAFDSIRSVSKDGAIWILDVMDPYSGRYKENIQKLKNNLEELGVDPFKANFTFEGPMSDMKFNRITVSREQMDAYAELLGFKIREVIEDVVGEGSNGFKNLYYILEIDPDYYPQNIEKSRFENLTHIAGLLDPGVDFNKIVKTWGASIGQISIWGLPDSTRKGYDKEVTVKRKGSSIEFIG